MVHKDLHGGVGLKSPKLHCLTGAEPEAVSPNPETDFAKYTNKVFLKWSQGFNNFKIHNSDCRNHSSASVSATTRPPGVAFEISFIRFQNPVAVSFPPTGVPNRNK